LGVERILVTNGATEAISVSLAAVIEPGDEVIILEPCWTNYASMVTVWGGRAVAVATDFKDGVQPDPERVAAAITARTKALNGNSPNNPTGIALSAERLGAIAELAQRHDPLVISDEVYDAIGFAASPFASMATLPGMPERTVIVNAFSKTYAMTGWRMGYAALPAVIAREATRAHAFINTSINTFIQHGGAAALAHTEADAARMQAAYVERR
jgi:aspartate/methionine/tyrosine aminotransferase